MREYNGIISKLAEEKETYYVNVAEALEEDDGSLPDDAAPDGVHLVPKYCTVWLDYLKTHTVKGE